MNENNTENGNSSIAEAEEGFVPPAGETVEQRAERLESSNKQLFERAKKAEGFVKGEDGKWTKPPKSTTNNAPAATVIAPNQDQNNNLSTVDTYALIDAKVPQEDIGEVAEYAKFKKISIADALKTPFVQGVLKENAEKRNIAEATNTGGSKRTTGKTSPEEVMANASKGVLPDSDDGIADLAQARIDAKRSKKN